MGGPSNERRRKARADRARKRDAGSAEQQRAGPEDFGGKRERPDTDVERETEREKRFRRREVNEPEDLDEKRKEAEIMKNENLLDVYKSEKRMYEAEKEMLEAKLDAKRARGTHTRPHSCENEQGEKRTGTDENGVTHTQECFGTTGERMTPKLNPTCCLRGTQTRRTMAEPDTAILGTCGYLTGRV